jgi:hypothetical protein
MRTFALLLLWPLLSPLAAQTNGSAAHTPNSFKGSFTMLIHSYKKDKEEKDSPMTMRLWSTSDMLAVQPLVDKAQMQEMRMVMDLRNRQQYMLMKDEKGKGTAIKQPMPPVRTNDKQEKEGEMTVQRTTETRTIDGHLCHKYIGTSAEGTWTAWVAEDVKMPLEEFGRAFSAGKANRPPSGKVEGMPLESTFVSADGRDKIVMYIRDLKLGTVDEAAFSTDGYEVMEMPAMMMGSGH